MLHVNISFHTIRNWRQRTAIIQPKKALKEKGKNQLSSWQVPVSLLLLSL